MTMEIVTVPCLSDNYAYLLRGGDDGAVAIVDAPDADAIIAALEDRGWRPATLLITHHHPDHVQGIAALKDRYGCAVVGPAGEADKIDGLDRTVAGGDRIEAAGQDADVIDVPGHTLGHIAFHFAAAGAAFTADSLMVMGCGRLFEGSPRMMWDSLQRLMALPDATRIYSGHEYTATNARFALSVDPDNRALEARAQTIETTRANDHPTVPATLAEEKETNPFLRAGRPAMKSALGMADAADVDVFAELRARKDRF